MKFAALSAALALVSLAHGLPTAAESDLEIRKKDKTGTSVCCPRRRESSSPQSPILRETYPQDRMRGGI
jgi:hypothetical protein